MSYLEGVFRRGWSRHALQRGEVGAAFLIVVKATEKVLALLFTERRATRFSLAVNFLGSTSDRTASSSVHLFLSLGAGKFNLSFFDRPSAMSWSVSHSRFFYRYNPIASLVTTSTP